MKVAEITSVALADAFYEAAIDCRHWRNTWTFVSDIGAAQVADFWILQMR